MSNRKPDIAAGTGMIPGGFRPARIDRRRLLRGAFSLLVLSAASRFGGGIPGSGRNLPSAGVGEGFVMVDDWVLPARYFRD